MDRNAAAVAGDDIVRDGETQARAFTDVLGREKGVEQPRYVLWLNAGAVIADFNEKLFALMARANRHPAAAWTMCFHRLERVHQQVEQDLLKLGRDARYPRIGVIVLLDH